MSVKKKNLMYSMKSMYMILKEKLAFSKYDSVLQLLGECGVDVTSLDALPGNANLRSERIKDEIIQVLGTLVLEMVFFYFSLSFILDLCYRWPGEEPIKEKIRSSLGWSLLIDETSDISNREQVSVYAHYLQDNGEEAVPDVCCSFLGLVEVIITMSSGSYKALYKPNVTFLIRW